MRRLRFLRWALLVFLGTFALWLCLDIWRGVEPVALIAEPPPPPAAPKEFPIKGPVELSSEGFMITQERAGEVVMRLQAGKMIGMEEGSRILEDILIEVRPEPDKRPDRLVRIEGRSGRFDPAAQAIDLHGEIHVALDSGEWLQTEGLRYQIEQRIAAASGTVRFELDGSTGRATGLVADLINGNIELVTDVVMEGAQTSATAARIHAENLRRTPDSTLLSGAVLVEGSWGAFRGRDLRFTPTSAGGATGVSHSTGTLDAADGDRGDVLHLTGGEWTFELDDNRSLRAVVCNQRARFTREGQDDDVQLAAILAPEIRLDLPVDGTDGPPRLQARGNPDDLVVTQLTAGPVAEVRSVALDIVRRGPTHEREAIFTGSVEARGENQRASGHRLSVLESRAAELRGDEAVPARVTQGEQILAADTIQLAPDGSGAAQGHVALTRPSDGSGEERLVAAADTAAFSADGSQVQLGGNVRAWHGERTLASGWLEIDRNAGTLRAEGSVHLTFRPEIGLEGLRASERVQVTADSARWEDTPRRVTFDGSVHLTQEAAEVKADHLVLDESTAADRALLAEGDVSFHDPQWTGTGDRLLYLHAVGSYELQSYNGLARVVGSRDEGFLTGRLLRFHRGGGTVEVVSGDDGRATVRFDGTQPNR